MEIVKSVLLVVDGILIVVVLSALAPMTVLVVGDALKPPDPFAIERIDNSTVFTVARWVRVTRKGHLVLWSLPWKREAMYKDGTWIRVQRGIGPEDLK